MTLLDKVEMIKVCETKDNPSLLDAVIRLGDANKKYLGFYPKVAFERSSSEGKIIGAVNEDGNLLGYLLYYEAKCRAVLQHLCVDEKAQKGGVGRLLVKALQRRTKHLDGILLNCRRDFPAHDFWNKMSFVAVDEKYGRGKKAKILTTFWYDHGHPDLFMGPETQVSESMAIAVVDHNIFIDWNESTNLEGESDALRSDWLRENAKFVITDESFNELNRINNAEKRKAYRSFARTFEQLQYDKKESEEHLEKLKKVLGEGQKASDWSDLRQLAIAISGGAHFFITRDSGILKKAEDISELFGIEVSRPLDFVLYFDELIRGTEYRPERLKGSCVTIRKIGRGDIARLSELFVDHSAREGRKDLEKKIRNLYPLGSGSIGYIYENNGETIGFIVMVAKGKVCDIPFFRIMKGRLCSTLARNISLDIIKETVRVTNGKGICRIIDPCLNIEIINALEETGFVKSGGLIVKVNLNGIHDSNKVCEIIRELSGKEKIEENILRSLADFIESSESEMVDKANAFKIERRIWPGRLKNTGLESFVVPIQPRWAMHLFDENLAKSNLFGAVPLLALNCENVYYRGAKPRVLRAPGRILWYISEDKSYQKTKSLRACSTIADVTIGPAKVLYKRFKRLGIYSWNNVVEKSHNDPEGDVMAVRFTNTELFEAIIPRKQLDTVLRKYMGTNPPLSTAVKIPNDCFCELYRMGSADKKEDGKKL